jgi:hypothetical protein
MVLIRVKNKDSDKVFNILLKNGRFSEFKGNKFRIDENEEKTLQKIKDKKIQITEI